MDNQDNTGGSKLSIITKCHKCDREMSNPSAHFACNRCEIAPLCLGCILRYHRACDIYKVQETVSSFVSTALDWMVNTCAPDLDNITSRRCFVDQAVSQVKSQLDVIGGKFAEMVERKYMKDAGKMVKLYEELDNSLDQFGTYLKELNLHLNNPSSHGFSVQRFKEAEKCFDRLSDSFTHLQNLLIRKESQKLLHLRILLQLLHPEKVEWVNTKMELTSDNKENVPPVETAISNPRGRKRSWSGCSAGLDLELNCEDRRTKMMRRNKSVGERE